MHSEMQPRQIVIENLRPEIDAGRFPAKATLGETVRVEASIFTDGHDALAARLLYRRRGEGTWHETPMTPQGNDRWNAGFRPASLGGYEFTVEAWVDRFATWQRDLAKKNAAGTVEAMDLRIGASLLKQAAARAGGLDAERLKAEAESLETEEPAADAIERALDSALARLTARHADRDVAARYPRTPTLVVEREKGRFSTWYEMFPRSCSPEPGRRGTLLDVIERLPYVAGMGFDVLYLPPVHPIGRTRRKGRNNTPHAEPGDPGSPWAIGSGSGGHKALHPGLGTLDEFRLLMDKAAEHGVEIALDMAFQCSPDHPYVQEHPEWFRHRPDDSIQHAENPPKKYEDIYPLNFESEQREALWKELRDVFQFWIDLGVRIFRVDNPHTKPFGFWEWILNDIRAEHPDVIFLSEAFTRPSVMGYLAKAGFSQSYTYFAWRNTARELTDYFTDLSRPEIQDYFRPNLWPNTPDILTEYLQAGGPPAFRCRYLLAATLGANCGIYGPAFELCLDRPLEIGSEEYLNSEKYEVRHWDLDDPNSLHPFIARVNRARLQNPALQSDRGLRFHPTDNDRLLCYSKTDETRQNTVLCVVNLDPHYTQSGWIDLPLDELDLDPDRPYQMHDLISDARFIWHGARNYIELDPNSAPGHVFLLRRKLRTERDFDYFM